MQQQYAHQPSRESFLIVGSLPDFLRPLFWEYKFNVLSWPSDRDLVTRKILENGTWEDLLWLRRKSGDATLKQWIIDHQGKGLSPRQLRYWESVLEIKHSLVSHWINEKMDDPWYQRTR